MLNEWPKALPLCLDRYNRWSVSWRPGEKVQCSTIVAAGEIWPGSPGDGWTLIDFFFFFCKRLFCSIGNYIGSSRLLWTVMNLPLTAQDQHRHSPKTSSLEMHLREINNYYPSGCWVGKSVMRTHKRKIYSWWRQWIKPVALGDAGMDFCYQTKWSRMTLWWAAWW